MARNNPSHALCAALALALALALHTPARARAEEVELAGGLKIKKVFVPEGCPLVRCWRTTSLLSTSHH